MARIIITNVHTREEREIDQAALPFFPDWIYTRDAVAGVPSDLPVYLSTDQFVAAVSDASNEVGAALRAALGSPDPVLSAFVYDGSGNLTSYAEDGVTITLTYNADGTVATSKRGTAATKTFTYYSGNLAGVA